jgi:signal transduction histidine kinase
MGGESISSSSTELRVLLGRERAKVRAIQDIGAALGSTINLDELLSLIMNRISNIMFAERSTLYLLDDERNELWSKIAQESEVTEIRMKVGEGIAGWVAEHGEVLNIPDAYDDRRFDPAWDLRSGYRTSTILSVPMKNQHGRTIGVTQCLNKTDGPFTADDEALLLALAAQAAITIENSKLFLSMVRKNFELMEIKEQLESKVHELDVLFDITSHSAQSGDLESLLLGTIERALVALDCERASVLLQKRESADLKVAAAMDREGNALPRYSVPAGVGICGWVVQENEAASVVDAKEDPRYAKGLEEHSGFAPQSVLCMPMRFDDGMGVLELFDKRGTDAGFDDADVRLAGVIAGQLQQLINLARAKAVRAREDRLSNIGQALSGVLHDMKTPMTVISGYLQLLREEEDPERRERHAGIALRQVELINTMTQETLAFARGETKLWVRKVYLHRYFREVAEHVRRDLAARSVEVKLTLEDRGIAYFDEAKIQRVVHNLARNAAEAIGEEAGVFEIHVSRRESDNALLIACRDDGPGVPDAIRERLFDSFITHGKKGGTGLGLAIAKKAAEDHGGGISCESEPGSTVFTITLPTPGEGSD